MADRYCDCHKFGHKPTTPWPHVMFNHEHEEYCGRAERFRRIRKRQTADERAYDDMVTSGATHALDAPTCDGGCSCHISPPCGFCTSLTEDEADAFANGGLDAVMKLRYEDAPN